jgi:hypothetical protein
MVMPSGNLDGPQSCLDGLVTWFGRGLAETSGMSLKVCSLTKDTIRGRLSTGSWNFCVWTDDWSSEIDLWVEDTSFQVIKILTRIRSLVFARFDEPEEA